MHCRSHGGHAVPEMKKYGTAGSIQAGDTAAGEEGGSGEHGPLRKGQARAGCSKCAVWRMLQAVKGRLPQTDGTVHGMPKLLFHQRKPG